MQPAPDHEGPTPMPPEAGRLRHWIGRLTEPIVLFPGIAAVLLVVIWGLTLNLIDVERTLAEQAAVESSRNLADTYEAQAVRALREIDQTLKLVRFTASLHGGRAALKELESRSLLPPALLFSVSIADRDGDVVASTRPVTTPNVAGRDWFEQPRRVDALYSGRPADGPVAADAKLQFSRRLVTRDGAFDGIVFLSVDADYFVSGYEPSRLGERGMLGLLGQDGVFRVRRTGDTIHVGDDYDPAALEPAAGGARGEVRLSTNPWDGERRYTTVRPLNGFDLSVVVGRSADEQLAESRSNRGTYLWRASLGSVVLVLVATLLYRMSRDLARTRERGLAEQLAHAARVEYLAYHDGLTGMPNRSLFSKLLAQSIAHAQRYDRQLAVLFLDLDRFKQINDTLGHEAGDQLLKQVARRLDASLRGSDTVARLGGDEFVVVLPILDEASYVATVAQKILASLAQPFMLSGQEFRVTVSIGIATYPDDGLDEQTLTRHADVAMYQAKELGKNNFQYYSHHLDGDAGARLTLESDLRNALARGEFQLHYQARHDIDTGAITGTEALLRWEHPMLGIVAPLDFMAAAEETGLIVPIGMWVLKTACLQNVAWQKGGLGRLIVAVNLSPPQFADDALLPDVAEILAVTGMDAHLLELEIGEGLLLRDPKRALRTLAALKQMGVRIAIDDFGVGYATLATLRQFPLDTIKIDQSLVRDVESAAADRAMTEAIVAIGRTMSPIVVAQGIETREQADFLRDSGCNEIQGFYLGVPGAADRVAQMLAQEAEVRTALSRIGS